MIWTRSSVAAVLVAAAVGAGAWEYARRFGGRREAWDSALYWSAAYPAMLIASALIGFVVRRDAWVFAAAMLAAQAAWSLAVALATTGAPSLFPLGLIMFAALFLPCAAVAMGAQWLGLRTIGKARAL
jgi:hypothetical protein